jgi:hypothetical protein
MHSICYTVVTLQLTCCCNVSSNKWRLKHAYDHNMLGIAIPFLSIECAWDMLGKAMIFLRPTCCSESQQQQVQRILTADCTCNTAIQRGPANLIS